MRDPFVSRHVNFWSLAFSACVLLLGVFPESTSAAPAFSVQPFVSTNLVGGTIELTLVEDGGPPEDAFAFVWKKNNEELEESDRVTGTGSPVLRIAPAVLEDTGVYSLTFTNQADTNLSRYVVTATAYVVGQPEFVQEPYAVTDGLDVTFRTVATGGLISYQWYWQGEPLAGATNSSLRFTNAYENANAGYYTVRISNPANPEGILASGSLLVNKPAPGGTYHGIFYNQDVLAAESSGWIQFTLSSSRRTFSGKVLLGTATYSFSGAFPPEHYVEVEAERKDAAPLLLRMQLLTINNAPQVTGEIEGDGWTSSLRAVRLHYTSKSPTALAGKYTLALQNTNTSVQVPNGDGFASVSISPAGAVRLKGRTADGTPFSQSTGLSRLQAWPLHVVTHRGRGRMLGWLRTVQLPNSSIQGEWAGWVKDPGPDPNYPDGFALQLQPLGSTFVPLVNGKIMSLTNGVAALSGGDRFLDGNPYWTFIRVTLRPPSSFRPESSPERLNLSASRNTGLVSGSFRDLATGRKAPIYGAIFQQQVEMRGFFLSTNTAGAFWLGPQ